MPNSIFDDLGYSNNATATTAGDPVAWTILGEAGKDPQGQLAVASTIANRANSAKTDYGTIVTDPKQGYEAWQDSDKRAQLQRDYPVGSDAYNEAHSLAEDIKSGKIQPLSYTHFYSPEGQKAKGRSAPEWDDNKSGVDIAGNRFFTLNDSPGSIFKDLKYTDSPEELAKDSATDAAQYVKPDEGKEQSWPVYDPYNHVGRNADGSIAYVGKEPSVKYDTEGHPIVTITGNDKGPEAINSWLAANPNDIAHKAAQAETAPSSSAGTSNLTGIEQGLANVKNSVEGLAAPISPSIRADLAQGLINRQGNDTAYAGSIPYGLGKFGGEMLGTAPAMMIPGVGELAEGVLNGTRFAKGAGLVLNGAQQGAGYSALTSAGSNQSLGDQVLGGAVTGAVAAPIFHGLSSVVTAPFRKTVSSPIQDLAGKANDFGITLHPDQILRADKQLGKLSPGVAKTAEVQPSQFASAVGQTFTVPKELGATGLTADVMTAAKKSIGARLNDFATNKAIGGTTLDDMLGALDKVPSEARRAGVTRDQVDSLKETINDIKNLSKGKGSTSQFTGEHYHSLIRDGSPFDRLQESDDSNVRFYAGKIKDLIDDHLEKSVDSSLPDHQWENLASDAALSDFRQARLQYKNMMTAKPAIDNTTGLVDPNKLDASVERNFTDRKFSKAGPLGDLGEIGTKFLKTSPTATPSSGMSGWHKLLGTALSADAVAAFAQHPVLASKMAAATGIGVGAKYTKDAIQNYLSNNQFLRASLAGKPLTNPALSYLGDKFSVAATNNFLQQQQGAK